jgi:hypothetical protein
MDVSTPQGAGAAPGLVYTSVQVLDSIREIGSSIPLNIYFKILLSVRKKRSPQAEPALKKGLRRLSVR